jgi:DNA (cytosine-5)-methyltransferase 1
VWRSSGSAEFLHLTPEAFKFPGSYLDRWARIGNSVPPLFMKAIADYIRRNVLQAEAASKGFTAA